MIANCYDIVSLTNLNIYFSQKRQGKEVETGDLSRNLEQRKSVKTRMTRRMRRRRHLNDEDEGK